MLQGENKREHYSCTLFEESCSGLNAEPYTSCSLFLSSNDKFTYNGQMIWIGSQKIKDKSYISKVYNTPT